MASLVSDKQLIKELFASLTSLHSRLEAFEKAQTEQQNFNKQLHADITALQSKILKLKPSPVLPPTTPVILPPPVPSTASATSNASTQPTQPQQGPPQQPRPQPPQWTEVISKRRRDHALRTLQPPRPPTDTPAYTMIHLYRTRRMSLLEYRNTLAAINIDSKRILAITFPARNISSILIHSEYKPEVLRLLTEGNIAQVPAFNPLDPKHLADPRFQAMAAPQRSRIAAALHTDRCIRTIRFLKKHNVPGVLKYFLSQNWIPAATAHDLTSELLPRPAKHTVDPSSNIGQLLMQPAFAKHLNAMETTP